MRCSEISRVIIDSLLEELSTLNAALYRIRQRIHARHGQQEFPANSSDHLEATTSILTDIVDLLQSELESSYPSSALLYECLQQLRDERPALQSVLKDNEPRSQHLMPPTEAPFDTRPDGLNVSQPGHPPAFTPSTGMTPSVDRAAWIEPPPQYSPPAAGGPELMTEIKGSMEKEAVPPEPQARVDDEVFDSDSIYNAVLEDNTALINDLLEQGAKPDAAIRPFSRTALHQAAHTNRVSCLSMLLRHGASMTAEDTKGDTPLHLAAWAGNVEALSTFLAHGVEIDWLSGRDGYSPLWCAVTAYHIDAARLLLKHGARVSLRSASGNGLLPLHQAAVTGQSAMCELLVERGALVDAVDDDGNTALHYAATSGSVPTVKVLLCSGAAVNMKQGQGLTAAHWAAHKGHTEVLRLLLTHGALVNARGVENVRPLHLAANRGHTQAVLLLLEYGADWRKEALWDGVQGTAVQMARSKGHARVAKLIERHASA